NQTSYNGIALKNKTHVYSKQSRDSKSLKSYSKGSILKYSSLNKNWYVTGVFINGKKQTGYIHKSDVENADDKSKSLQGVASKSPTRIYASASTNSKSIKSYKAGSILKYSTFSKDWYRTGVFINGKKQTGYIHKSDVENADDKGKSLQGVASKSPTHIYASASTNSKSIKSYKVGSILKYSTFSKDWYRTGVFINGKKQTGYIHKSHVENADDKGKSLQGVASKSPTHIYASASTNSKSIKSYKVGSIIKYSTFYKDWYRTSVFINGKKQTGYIHKSHVENATDKPKSSFGVALSKNTNIYAKASKDSKALKSYKQGTILKYSTFSKNWYKTGVFINGKKHIGYIHKSDVGTPAKQEKMRGIGLNKKTHVYEEPFLSAKSLKNYAEGTILSFSSYAHGWYKTGVYINGVYKVGYIKVDDVELAALEDAQNLIEDAFALKNPTNIYHTASRNSKIIKTYKKGSPLKFRSLSKNWYQARVKVNGSYKTGYIHTNDVGKISTQNKTTTYNISLNDMIRSQINNATKPKTSHTNMYVKKDALKKVKGKWKVKGKNQNVYDGTGKNKKLLGTIDERYVNDTITVYENSSTSKYYKFQTWIIPLEDELKKYINP